MKEISIPKLKMQLTNEYLRTGGTEKILDPILLKDLLSVRVDKYGEPIAETVSSLVNAFMLGILATHKSPTFLYYEHISEYKSFLQKSLFFDQINIETEEGIDELFNKYESNKDFLFRGQREAKWRLYSSLQRFWVWDKFDKTQQGYEGFLRKITNLGKELFSGSIEEILLKIHIDSINELAILGFLQHHNCPTPLLDWTYNFKNAMFFGIDGIEETETVVEIEKYFSVYFIEERNFAPAGMRELISESLKTLSESKKLELIKILATTPEIEQEMINKFKDRSIYDKEKLTGSGLISRMVLIETLKNIPIAYFSDKDISDGIAFSLYNSDNIITQDGVFTWNSSFDKPLEVIGLEQHNEGGDNSVDYRFSECYNINKKLEPYIRSKLELLGIDGDKIYPDKTIDTKIVYTNSKS